MKILQVLKIKGRWAVTSGSREEANGMMLFVGFIPLGFKIDFSKVALEQIENKSWK